MGALKKMYVHPVHTKPNHHPTKMDVLLKTFVQNILAAGWLVRHSSTSAKQKRRPLPSLLSVFFFYAYGLRNRISTARMKMADSRLVFSLIEPN